ncbi:unnamed protein product, partial [Linum tenue]
SPPELSISYNHTSPTAASLVTTESLHSSYNTHRVIFLHFSTKSHHLFSTECSPRKVFSLVSRLLERPLRVVTLVGCLKSRVKCYNVSCWKNS